MILAAAWKIDLRVGRRGGESGKRRPAATAAGKERDYDELR